MKVTIDRAKIRAQIDAAITAARARGWSIEFATWVDPRRKCCCPLGAVALQSKQFVRVRSENVLGVAAKVLDVRKKDLDPFTEAFDYDGQELDDFEGNKRAIYALGRAYRRRFLRLGAPNNTGVA
jgi:hypothetical protein